MNESARSERRRPNSIGTFAAAGLGLFLGFSGCQKAQEHGESVVARIDGEPILLSEVERRAAWRLYRARVDAHMIIEHELEDLIEERVLERAAQERGLPTEQLLRDAEADLPAVSESEIDRYLERNPTDVPGSRARIRVRHYLEETRRLERRLAFLESLREDVEIELLLERPERPCVALDLAGAPSRGPASARATVVFFADASSAESARVARALIAIEHELPGELRVLVRSLPRERDELGLRTAQLLAAAQAEGVFWEIYDRLAQANGVRKEADVEAIANAADRAELLRRVARDDSTLVRVRKDLAHARDAGVYRAPTLFVNGRYFMGLEGEAALREVVLEALEESTPSCAAR